MVTSAERLRRLLALVPYVVARRAVGLAETAATFGMTERELIDDLNLAWCVELKSPEPYCPIDLSYEDGEITISQAESIARPLRLAADEASALLSRAADAGRGGRRQRRCRPADSQDRGCGRRGGGGELPGDNPNRSLRTVPGFPPRSTPPWPQANGSTCATTCQAAMRQPSGTWTRYELRGHRGPHLFQGGAGGPRGCGTSGSTGFSTSTVLDVPAEIPEEVEWADEDEGLFRPSETDMRVELELAAGARWVAEYYPYESLTELGEGRLRVVFRTPNTDLFRRRALRLGEDCRVIAPAELAEEVRTAAAAALALYD